MHADVIKKHFEQIGARLEIRAPRAVRTRIDTALHLNVRRDKHGETFTMALHPSVEVAVINQATADRHLLLHTVDPQGRGAKFLCGHDERHWFVAAIPENAPGVVDIRTAKLALMPDGVSEMLGNLRQKQQLRRRNPAYVRQGEWFFVPAPYLDPDPQLILRNEPLTRGRGAKPHTMEFCYRLGGQQVWVNSDTILNQKQYEALDDNARRQHTWRPMTRDAKVYAMGHIKHADHATIKLEGWHHVQMNTEQQARAMRQVAFLD